MSRLLLGCVTVTASLSAVILAVGCSPDLRPPGDSQAQDDRQSPRLASRAFQRAGRASSSHPPMWNALVIPGCRLVPTETQEVPSQRDGPLLLSGRELEAGEPLPPEDRRISVKVPFIAIEVRPDEQVPESQLFTDPADSKGKRYRLLKDGDPLTPGRLHVGKQVKHYYRWREGDRVKKGQLLALVDFSLAADEFASKYARLVASDAEWQAGVAMRAEAEQRLRAAKKLFGQGAFSLEELRTAQLTLDRSRYDEVSKQQAVRLAQRELSQAQTLLTMFEIRSKIDGVILAITKKPGEAVRNLDPVFRLQDSRRLRIEGQVEWQHLPLLQQMKDHGRKLVVEPTQPVPPQRVLNGHLLEVTGVAVTKDVNRPQIVSGSEDGTVRLWDTTTGREQVVLHHPAPVRAVASTPPGAEANLCLAGLADGSGWLWDLNSAAPREPRKLSELHRGPVNTVAFRPDGKCCATGGEDGTICLWETASGRLLHRLTAAHRGRVTSVQLPSATRLVSAGADNCLLIWVRGEADTYREVARFDRRSGTVPCPGVSADGERVLLDVGKELRVMSLPEGTSEGILKNLPEIDAGTPRRYDAGKGAAEEIPQDLSRPRNFSTLALFSPDSRMALTVSDPGGHLQLWRTPTGTTRPCEVRQLVWKGAAATCGAFAPDGSFVVTGMKDRRVLVWPVPALEELTGLLEAEITLVDPSVDPKSRRVRVWAEMDNPSGRLIPGATVTLVSYPR